MYQRVQKRHFLVGLVEIKIGVDVFERKDQILFVGQSVEAEVAFLVGFGDVIWRDAQWQRVQVFAVGGIERDVSVFDGFLVLGIEYFSRDAKRVNVVAS